MKKFLIALLICSILPTQLHAQDIIVKKDGTILNVYNVEESSSSYFYTLEPSSGSAVEKIAKEDVFSVKFANEKNSTPTNNNNIANKASKIEREAVTANIVSEDVDKKKGRIIKASTPDGNVLNYAVLSETEHTLAVVKGKYKEKEYIIPEYVNINNIIYTVTEIDNRAFYTKYGLTKVQFPMTLKKLGADAFSECKIERIILPEGLEEIGPRAFVYNACNRQVYEIYIPSTVKKIGDHCFSNCGKDTSYRGFCQAYFSNMPAFITEGNCKSFGIDEVAVKEYQKNKK